MGVPYEMKPMASIQLNGTTPEFVEINWPHRSVISKILAVITDGVADPFTLAIYNHAKVVTRESVSDSEGDEDEVGKISDDMFRVTPDLTAGSNGKLLYFSEQSTGGYGYVVFSHKDRSDRQGQREAKIFVKLQATTPGTRQVELLIGGMKEIE